MVQTSFSKKINFEDFGTLALSPSTRSQTGLTGDFFKPRAFFTFFPTFQTYPFFIPKVGFPNRHITFIYLKYIFLAKYCQTATKSSHKSSRRAAITASLGNSLS